MRDQLKRLFGETALWTAANALSIGLAMIAAYLLSAAVFGSPVLTAGMVGVAVGVAVTWGSWISLTFTRSRGLRAAMKAVTLFPGFVLLAAGVFGFYVGVGSLLFWGVLSVSAFGTLASAVMLWGSVPRARAKATRSRLASGFLLYPLVTVASSGAIGAMWWWYLSTPAQTDWRMLFELSTILVTVLAVELCTTVIPAGAAMICSQLNTLIDEF